MTIKVLLVDDQALMRLGFSMVLSALPDIEVVGEAADGVTALAQALALKPDVVLMDIRMPKMDGIEATRRLVQASPEIKVLLLTTFDLDEYAFAGLKAGASGFLLKHVEPAELVAAIRAVAGGDAVVSARVTRRMLELFSKRLPTVGGFDGVDTDAGGGTEASLRAAEMRGIGGTSAAEGGLTGMNGAVRDVVELEMAALTAKEREVFDLLAAGLTNSDIAAKLFVSQTTVKSHVRAVLKKLALRDRVQVVVYAYDNGLISPNSNPEAFT
jgi:DNA-binding NarL/FixJ family response regulator